MIHHEQLRYELLRNSATRYDAQTGTSDAYLRSAFQNIEQVLEELSILQRKYMLHLNPGDPGLGLPFIRFLLKRSFNTGGKAKLNAFLQELQGYYDTIERTLLCYHPRSHDPSPLSSDPHPHEHQTCSRLVLDSSPTSTIPLKEHHAQDHFSSYSNKSSYQSPPTAGRPTSISYTRVVASSPIPSNATNIASWFGSNGTYISQEREDNCSGPLHREYSSGSSWD